MNLPRKIDGFLKQIIMKIKGFPKRFGKQRKKADSINQIPSPPLGFLKTPLPPVPPPPVPPINKQNSSGKPFISEDPLSFSSYGELRGLPSWGGIDWGGLIRVKTGEKIIIHRQVFMIGKDRRWCDYWINDVAISRHHAEIIIENNEYYIKDMASTNGTFVNEEKLQPGSKVKLENGTKIKLADEDFVFYLHRDSNRIKTSIMMSNNKKERNSL